MHKNRPRSGSVVPTLRIAFVEWHEALSTDDAKWSELESSIAALRPDILITNELPFGPWIAEGYVFSEDEARLSVVAHEKGLKGLIDLDRPAIISSRPIWTGKRLANEAFVLERRAIRPLHRKQYFPNEPGWFESEWYGGDDSGFGVAEVLGIKNWCAFVYGRHVQRTSKGLWKARGCAHRDSPRFGGRSRVVENRWSHGITCFRRLCCQFESCRHR